MRCGASASSAGRSAGSPAGRRRLTRVWASACCWPRPTAAALGRKSPRAACRSCVLCGSSHPRRAFSSARRTPSFPPASCSRATAARHGRPSKGSSGPVGVGPTFSRPTPAWQPASTARRRASKRSSSTCGSAALGRADFMASNSPATTRAGWSVTADSSCGRRTGVSFGKARPRRWPKRRLTFSISGRWPCTARTSGSPARLAASSGTRPTADSRGRRSARDKPRRSNGSRSTPNEPAGRSVHSARSSAPMMADRRGKRSAAAIGARHSCRSYRGPAKSRLPCSPSKRRSWVTGARCCCRFGRPTKGRPRCRRSSTCVCMTRCCRPAEFTPRSAGNSRWMCPASTATAKS